MSIQKQSQKYRSTFEFISVKYLAAHISNLSQVETIVFLTTGLSDQVGQYKLRVDRFKFYLNQMLENMQQCGAQCIIVLIPPPHPRIVTLIEYEFYTDIRNIIGQLSDVHGLKVRQLQ